jgi:hypothetical protein
MEDIQGDTSWSQDQVSQWLEKKGWGHFAPAFESK